MNRLELSYFLVANRSWSKKEEEEKKKKNYEKNSAFGNWEISKSYILVSREAPSDLKAVSMHQRPLLGLVVDMDPIFLIPAFFGFFSRSTC